LPKKEVSAVSRSQLTLLRDQQQQGLAAQIVFAALAADESFGARDSYSIRAIGPVAGIGHPIPVLAAARPGKVKFTLPDQPL